MERTRDYYVVSRNSVPSVCTHCLTLFRGNLHKYSLCPNCGEEQRIHTPRRELDKDQTFRVMVATPKALYCSKEAHAKLDFLLKEKINTHNIVIVGATRNTHLFSKQRNLGEVCKVLHTKDGDSKFANFLLPYVPFVDAVVIFDDDNTNYLQQIATEAMKYGKPIKVYDIINENPWRK